MIPMFPFIWSRTGMDVEFVMKKRILFLIKRSV